MRGGSAAECVAAHQPPQQLPPRFPRINKLESISLLAIGMVMVMKLDAEPSAATEIRTPHAASADRALEQVVVQRVIRDTACDQRGGCGTSAAHFVLCDRFGWFRGLTIKVLYLVS